MNQRGSASRKVWRFLCALFFTYHCAAVLVMSYPFSREYVGSWPMAPFVDYVSYTQQRQHWTMFVNWDLLYSIEPLVTYTTADGTEKTVGSLMPGFEPGTGGVRARIFFHRNVAARRAQRGYLLHMCREIKRLLHETPVSLSLQLKIGKVNEVSKILAGASTVIEGLYKETSIRCPDNDS